MHKGFMKDDSEFENQQVSTKRIPLASPEDRIRASQKFEGQKYLQEKRKTVFRKMQGRTHRKEE